MRKFTCHLIAGVCLLLPCFTNTMAEIARPGAATYEVVTHQYIAREAAGKSVNLRRFLQDLDLELKDYSNNFPNAAQAAFPEVEIDGTRAQGLIESGSVLEDANARFFHHFFDPVAMTGLNLPVMTTQPTARDWGFDGSGEDNQRDWQCALNYFENAITASTETTRTLNEERLFVTLGHVIHLIQDCCQPSHTRNDGHGGFGTGSSELERFGAASINASATMVSAQISGAVNTAAPLYFPTYQEFFDTAATFSNSNFFSDETIFSDYNNPSAAGTGTRTETVDGTTLEFVTSANLNDPLTSEDLRLARVNRGLIFTSHSLVSPRNLVVEDNAQVLVARAVRLSEGLINHFLRGRMQLSLDTATQTQLVVKNISDATLLGGAANARFVSGAIRFYYEAVDGSRIELPAEFSPYTVPPAGLAQNDEVTIPGDVRTFLDSVSDPSLPSSTQAREDRRVVASFRGQIGQEEGVAAARISFSDNVSLLLSFDVSGSVSTAQLNSATMAALTLLPILSGGDGNRVAVHSFSWTAGVNLSFTESFGAAESAINGLSSGGATALHDAIVLAGQQASAEAVSQGMTSGDAQQTIVILFTDGSRNNSLAGAAQAVNAISTTLHPEIDEVFLVFVGGSAFGSNALGNIAAQAGRQFFSLDSFGALTTVFLNLVQGATN